MKHVRIWFQKTGAAKYISHLDLNRCMMRAVHKAGIPLWYTQGFHPHAFLTFALPLSLGMEGLRESMDIKLEGDMEPDEMIARLNTGLPRDLRVYAVTDPVMKPGKIAYASFVAHIDPGSDTPEAVRDSLLDLLRLPEIRVEKRTKSGVRNLDIKPFFRDMQLRIEDGWVRADMTLPAGSTENINPALLWEAWKEQQGREPFVRLTRTGLYNEAMEPFA